LGCGRSCSIWASEQFLLCYSFVGTSSLEKAGFRFDIKKPRFECLKVALFRLKRLFSVLQDPTLTVSRNCIQNLTSSYLQVVGLELRLLDALSIHLSTTNSESIDLSIFRSRIRSQEVQKSMFKCVMITVLL
jgi:hypothetical protein